MKLAWSNLAKDDLQALWRFSLERWGRDVALRYLQDVRAAAIELSIDPLRARLLKAPFRIFRIRSHYLIAHADSVTDRVTIARVFHVAVDIERHLP